MTNSDRFIDAYNRIDEILDDEFGGQVYLSFSKKVVRSRNAVVRQFKEELLDYGELRNAIVHTPRRGKVPELIAEPHIDVCDRIEMILSELEKPKRVFPLFGERVTTVKVNDSIRRILEQVVRDSYSQFPVYDEDGLIVEIINTNTIARWVSAKMLEGDSISFEDTRVSDFFEYIEFERNFRFIRKDASIYEAYEMFIDTIDNHRRNLDVICITENGKRTEKILGMITIEDITSEIEF
ncbi:MAG: CBS domain-containing protein [Fermentimonas sp.]|jgi:predicted transcriptional regulator